MKDKYFTVIVCNKCKQGGGTLKKNGQGGYVHVKCPSQLASVGKEEFERLRRR